MAVALESENVGREPIEKEAIVRDDDRATREILERRFEGAKRFGIEIVGRLVEKEKVAAFFRSFAKCTRLRSPPDNSPTFFCWSAPLKLNQPQ